MNFNSVQSLEELFYVYIASNWGCYLIDIFFGNQWKNENNFHFTLGEWQFSDIYKYYVFMLIYFKEHVSCIPK